MYQMPETAPDAAQELKLDLLNVAMSPQLEQLLQRHPQWPPKRQAQLLSLLSEVEVKDWQRSAQRILAQQKVI